MHRLWAWGLRAALVALVVPFVTAGPAAAADAPHYHLAAVKEHPVPVTPVKGRPAKVPAMPAWDPAKAHHAWPAAGSADVPVAPTAARAAAMPLRVAQAPTSKSAKAAAGAAPVTRVHVSVSPHSVAQRLHVDGILFQVVRADGHSGSSNVQVGLDYSGFRDAYGADYGSRLRLVTLPACALTTPDLPVCQKQTPLQSSNNSDTQTVSAVIPLSTVTARDAPLLAATADVAGGGGSFGATSLSPSGQWSGGGSTGAFSWSYPIPIPDVPGGLQPSVGLSYNSQSVDGRTSTTSPQASWIGDGWDYSPGFIESSYARCADDDNGKGPQTSDQCWSDDTDQFTLSLNGSSNTLVHDTATGAWHPQGDSGEIVKVATDTVNPDTEHRYFTVTTRDGTTYYFGRNQLPGWSDHGTAADDPVTNSVWTTRVYGNDSGEYCHASTFAASSCAQAYRWNLDYVVDGHNNAISYWYSPETGYYGPNNTTTPAPYTRGGYLTKIQYGQRAGKVYDTAGTPAAAQVYFDTSERCLADSTFDCASSKLNATNAAHWPDVPVDQTCASSGTCNNHGPAYFTTKWLTGIRTQVLVAGAYKNVDSWALAHTFPPPTDAKDTTTPTAWLSSITRTGLDGGSAALKPVTFDGQSMIGRVDGLDGYQPLSRYRLTSVTTETGELISVNYYSAQCHRAGTPVMPSAPDTNKYNCYPEYWTPPGKTAAILDWFNKYLVHSVTEQDITGGGLPVETDYKYLGDPGWHFDDDPGTLAKYRTWNEWRGYAKVETRSGSDGGIVTLSSSAYFRGMDGDKTSTGTRKATLTDYAGDDTVTDKDEFAGQVFEAQNYNGDGGALLSDAVIDPWESAPTATQSRVNAGLDPLVAHQTGTQRERTTTFKADGKPRTDETDYTFDTASGLPIKVNDVGDTSTTADDRCEQTWYAKDGSGATIALPRRVQTVAVACTGTPHYPDDLISDDEAFFDGSTDNTAAVTGTGDVTMVKKADSVAADGTPHYVTAITNTVPSTGVADYDIYGRALSQTDALGRRTITTYTPATGAAPTKIKTTQPQVTGQLQGFSSTTTYDPARALPLSTTDAAGYTTSSTYDPLGRVTASWDAGFSQSLGADPNVTYSYNLSNATPSTVTTKTLVDNGSATTYRTSVSIYDALLRQRETQTATVDGGRVITDTAYDDHGWNVKVNGPYYTGGAPDGTLVYAPDDQVATESGTFYDGAGRVTASVAYSLASEKWRTTYAYPGSDRTDVTPPLGSTPTSTITDGRGRTVQLLQYHGTTPSGAADTVSYTYDKAGHQTGQVDADGNTWSSTYDLLGRKVSQTDPDTGRSTYAYDLAGQELSSTDARNKTVSTTYDEIGRPTAAYDTSGNATPSTANRLSSWTYDTLKKGLPTSSTSYDDGLAYTSKILGYDSHGWTQSTETIIPSGDGNPAGTYATDRTYTPTGNLHSYTEGAVGSLPQETVSYSYDAFGHPTSAGGDVDSWDYVDKLTWTHYDEPEQFTFGPSGNFTQTGYTYDAQTRRLTEQQTVAGSGRVLADTTNYQYQPAGTITKITDKLETGQTDTQCFTHDWDQRLTQAWTATDACQATPASGSAATVGGPAPYWQSWTYDTTGDRKTQTNHNLTGDAAQDSVSTYTDGKQAGDTLHAHTLASVSTHTPGAPQVDTNTAYTYDAAGNVHTRTTAAGTDTFTFNTQGKLAQLDQTGQAAPTKYVYDADGNLLVRRDAGGSEAFLGDEEVTLKAGDSTPSAVRYISVAGITVAVHSAAGVSYLVADRQGTGQLQIDATTQSITRRQYLPFGETRTATSGWVGDRGFVGGEQDDNTGLTNLGAREYDTSTGRFLTPDPLLVPGEPESWNAYAYADNSPVTLSDPAGTRTEECSTGEVVCTGNNVHKGDKAAKKAEKDSDGCNVSSCSSWSKPAPSQATIQAEDDALGAEQAAATAAATAAAAKEQKEGLVGRIVSLVGDLIGVNDAISCVTEGNVMGCINTALTAVPWTKLFKAAKVGLKALKIWRAVERAETAIKDAEDVAKVAEDLADVKRAAAAESAAADEAAAAEKTAAGDACPTPVHSFVRDTPVRLATGKSEPIAQIRAGDTVLATNPQTGLTKPERVQKVIVTHTDEDFTDLSIAASPANPNAPPAAAHTLTTTWHHPFWDATRHQWTDAHDLTPGTTLRQPDGTTATVVAVRNYHHHATTYDLTVADVHSYYVLAGETPVLVHNCGGSIPRHRSVCDCANGGKPQMLRGPKPAGTGPHNLKIAETADEVTDGQVIAGGARLPEREFATPGGFKGSRRPDILVERPDGTQYGINIGKQTMRSGAPIKREAEALQDLEGIGMEMHFVAYN
ncbi:RHS repeat-associated core domain-containing protein [Streptomyces sp. NPDC051976]|uniref:RHS repeat-associated core domain-containing protein n=1 Tax=Streptomyces sp. NPDC051976 TaxID=3154947 RepID=UPI00342987E3